MANEVARKPLITISAGSMAWKLPMALFIYFLLSVICGYLGAVHWLFEYLSHFRLQQFWLGLAFSVTFILMKMRWPAVVASGIAVLIGVQSLLPWYIPRQVASADSKTVRFLYINVWLRNTNHQAGIDLIRRENPDVIIGQEITPAWMEALRPLKAEYPYGMDLPIESPQGIALLSRVPLALVENVKIRSYNGPTIHAVLELDRKKVNLVTAHLAAPVSKRHVEAGSEQMRAMAEYLAGLGSPKILIGDLNCSMWSPGYAPIEEVTGMINARRGKGILATWPVVGFLPGIPIDHCIVSRDIGVSSARVGPGIGSDHYPIVYDLMIPISVKAGN